MTLQKEGRTTDRLLDGETDKEARGPHATKSPSPTEFVASLLQGPIDQGLEYEIPPWRNQTAMRRGGWRTRT